MEMPIKPVYWLFGAHQTILADASTTEGRYDYTLGRHPSGVQTPLHRHPAYSEQLFVLEGEYTAWVGDEVHVLKPGEECFIPAGVVHTIKATGPGTSRGLNVSAPSGFARLITGLGTPDTGDGPPSPADPDPEALARILAEIGDEILGPPGALPGSSTEVRWRPDNVPHRGCRIKSSRQPPRSGMAPGLFHAPGVGAWSLTQGFGRNPKIRTRTAPRE